MKDPKRIVAILKVNGWIKEINVPIFMVNRGYIDIPFFPPLNITSDEMIKVRFYLEGRNENGAYVFKHNE